MEILLFIVARLLLVCFTPVFIVYAIFKKLYQVLASISMSLALLIDTAGNIIGAEMLTDVLLKRNLVPFGKSETISLTLARNDALGNLSYCGTILKKILNFFDKDHLKKAFEKHQLN